MNLARYRRLQPAFYQLQAMRCTACRKVHFPSRMRCLDCGAAAMEPARLSGQGRVLSFARMHHAARGFQDSIGSLTALIELREGVRLVAQLTDVGPEGVGVGQEVEMVLRRLRSDDGQGMIVYGYKFRPVLKAQANTRVPS